MHDAESPGQFAVRGVVQYLKETNWSLGEAG